MTRTPDLIDALATDLRPVRRLASPAARLARWSASALVVTALLVAALGPRPDLADRLRDPVFAIGLAAALACAIAAAAAAMIASMPDRSRAWLLLPLPALGIWISTVGYGCLAAWVGLGPEGLRSGDVMACFAIVLSVGVPLGAVTLAMLRHAAHLRATPVAMAGGLAVAGFSAATLAIVHQLDASAMILIWNFGTAAALAGLGGAVGAMHRHPPSDAAA